MLTRRYRNISIECIGKERVFFKAHVKTAQNLRPKFENYPHRPNLEEEKGVTKSGNKQHQGAENFGESQTSDD